MSAAVVLICDRRARPVRIGAAGVVLAMAHEAYEEIMAEVPVSVGQIEPLLAAYAAGDESAFERLFALLYTDLRRIAHRHLRTERQHHTLCTTALVHEAYLKLASWPGEGWAGRAQFLAFSSRAMRNILVDYARRRDAQKRGDGNIGVALDAAGGVGDEGNTVDLLALNEALERLGERDPGLVRVVECRFFGGLTANESAEALGVPLRTLERSWTRAKAYLCHLLRPQPAES